MQRAMACLIVVAFLGLFSVPGLADETAKTRPTDKVDYNRDVRPILSKNCFACHGADNAHRAAGLRLDQRDAAIKPRKKSGPAIVAGAADKSELVRRILAGDVAERMPPKETGNVLTPEQIDVLKRWIAQGANYADHWAFSKPQPQPLPKVRDAAWPRNGIDHFVLARLEKEGLKPAPLADKFALLRRASLDLRGLPPTPEEVDAFASDDSADAYERAVERFLKDPAYGERWARMWLDLARYADSAGYGSDPLRPNIWRYRDWVIDAFNRNLPYDRFTIEQLAGDLLPHAGLEQKMATAFHRNTMTNTEGGTDDEEFRVAAIKDRVDTTLVVWMGLTMGCAKCHNHKYDPISQKDYYRFYAFFNQTADNDQPDEKPTMPAPTPELEQQLFQIDQRLAELNRQLNEPNPQVSAEQARWEAELRPQSDWVVLDPASMRADGGATLKKLPDRSLLVEGANPASDRYTIVAASDLKGITAFRLEALPDASLPGGGSGRAADGNFVLSKFSVSSHHAPRDGTATRSVTATLGRSVRIIIPGDAKILSLAEVQVFSKGNNVARAGKAEQSSTDYDGPAQLAIDGNTDGDYFKAKSTTHTKTESNPWWQVKLADMTPIEQVVVWNRTDGGVGVRLTNFRVEVLDDAGKVVWKQDVSQSPSPKLELSLSGEQTVSLSQALADFSQQNLPVANALKQADLSKSGWGVAPQQKTTHAAFFVAAGPLSVAPAQLTFHLDHSYRMANHALGRFRLSVTNDPRVLQRSTVPADILAIVDTPAEERSKEQQEKLAGHYRGIAPALKTIRDEIARLDKSKPAMPMVPVMVELPPNQRRETRLMLKGNFLTPGDKLEASVPESFHALPQGAPLDRLGVARWLVDANNPLTARVAVNRFWAQLFGAGIVRTEEDFGTQGDLPSHPELLDWLALEFARPSSQATPWDMKALLKLMVTSATYRQSSKVTPEKLAKDPKNQLLSRGPRFRLEAEMVRDQALALSGLLSRKVGGPSVYPPQPDGLWQAAFNGQRTWATSKGEDRYRRGLYTFWRRTIPYPAMATFDAPSRETCTLRRIRTNTPLQAFVTLNDPCFVEASQALARRIVREGFSSVEDRARYALRLSLSRPANVEQIKHVVELFQSELAHYRKDPKAAVMLATEPLGPLPQGLDPAEIAAWTVVANVLLNMDGVLTKG